MRDFGFLFMADCQLGCYATFSGLTVEAAADYARRDMHVASVPTATGFAWDAERYEQAIAAANRLRPALVIMGGDMVDDARDPAQLAELQRITNQLDGIPMHWVPGNHDAADDGAVPTPDSLERYRATFGPDFYAFEHEGVAFIVVNTVVWDHPELVPGEWERQLRFLEDELRAASRRGVRHTLVFGHHPPFTSDQDEPDTYWNIPTVRRRQVLDLLQSHGCRAFFCGHWHRNGGGMSGDVEVVVTGPVGLPLGMDPSGFRIVQVGDEVVHRYVTLQGAPSDPVTPYRLQHLDE